MKKLLHIKNFSLHGNIFIELLLIKKDEKYVFIFSDAEPIDEKHHKETVNSYIEELIIQLFNQIKTQNPHLELDDFVWIEFLNFKENEEHSIPIRCLMYREKKAEYDENGFLKSAKFSIQWLLSEDNPPKSVIEVPEKLDKMFYYV